MQTARAVIFNSAGQLLMIERHKNGHHYFVLPGGHVEQNETAEQAAVREVFEETGFIVRTQKPLYTSMDTFGQQQIIFLCNSVDGSPQLLPGSIEAQKAQNSGQTWNPAWFAGEFLANKTVFPIGLLTLLDQDVAANFANNPRKIDESAIVE